MLAGLSLAVRYHLPCLPRRTHSVFNEGSANSLELVLPKKDGLQADSGAVTKALSQNKIAALSVMLCVEGAFSRVVLVTPRVGCGRFLSATPSP